jgi:hypothetical protein
MLHLSNLVDANFSPSLISRVTTGVQTDNLDISMLARGYFLAGVAQTAGRLSPLAVKCLSQV